MLVNPTHSSRRLNALQAAMPACAAYLEVGVHYGRTFETVDVPFRWGVDPVPMFDVKHLPQGVRFSVQTSDEFFQSLPRQHKFDLVLLDGLHEWYQTYKDLMNTLCHTTPHAVIIIDDVVPDNEWAALPNQQASLSKHGASSTSPWRWQGDVYKIMVAIGDQHPELNYAVIGESANADNPQALVWRRDPRRPNCPQSISDSRRADIDSLTYDDVFVGGEIPLSFQATSEADGIKSAVEASWSAWNRT